MGLIFKGYCSDMTRNFVIGKPDKRYFEIHRLDPDALEEILRRFGKVDLVGKQFGVFLLCFVAIKAGLAKLPGGASWGSLYGVAILSGVGFTMSLFIDTLAFQNLPADTVFDFDARLGILLGSLASGVVGYLVLDRTLPKAQP